MTSIGSFREWRDFDAHCEKIKRNVERELKYKAKELRNPSLTEEKIEILALDLGEEGEENLKEKIKATYPDAAYSRVISLFMAKSSASFNAPFLLQEKLMEIIKGEKEPEPELESEDEEDLDEL